MPFNINSHDFSYKPWSNWPDIVTSCEHNVLQLFHNANGVARRKSSVFMFSLKQKTFLTIRTESDWRVNKTLQSLSVTSDVVTRCGCPTRVLIPWEGRTNNTVTSLQCSHGIGREATIEQFAFSTFYLKKKIKRQSSEASVLFCEHFIWMGREMEMIN